MLLPLVLFLVVLFTSMILALSLSSVSLTFRNFLMKLIMIRRSMVGEGCGTRTFWDLYNSSDHTKAESNNCFVLKHYCHLMDRTFPSNIVFWISQGLMFPRISLTTFSEPFLITPMQRTYNHWNYFCLHLPHSGNFDFQIFILRTFFGNLGGGIVIGGYSCDECQACIVVFITVKIRVT